MPLAIADYAGGHWPETARATALKLSGVSNEALSVSAELLADIRDIFEWRAGDKIPTADLLAMLNADEEKPWATYSRGRPLTARNLAKLLGEYGIRPHNVWMGPCASPKGYSRDQFQDTFARYLPEKAPDSAADPDTERRKPGESPGSGLGGRDFDACTTANAGVSATDAATATNACSASSPRPRHSLHQRRVDSRRFLRSRHRLRPRRVHWPPPRHL